MPDGPLTALFWPGTLIHADEARLRLAVALDVREEKLIEIGFDGYAVGGLAVGEGQRLMLQVLDHTVPALPEETEERMHKWIIVVLTTLIPIGLFLWRGRPVQLLMIAGAIEAAPIGRESAPGRMMRVAIATRIWRSNTGPLTSRSAVPGFQRCGLVLAVPFGANSAVSPPMNAVPLPLRPYSLRLLLRPLYRVVAKSGSPELFAAMTLLSVLATAWVASLAGLSMALGAVMMLQLDRVAVGQSLGPAHARRGAAARSRSIG